MKATKEDANLSTVWSHRDHGGSPITSPGPDYVGEHDETMRDAVRFLADVDHVEPGVMLARLSGSAGAVALKSMETPEAMARRLDREHLHVGEGCALVAIRADREQIATWCAEKAAEAKREAEAQSAQSSSASTRERVARCEGQASFAEALAALLRGAK